MLLSAPRREALKLIYIELTYTCWYIMITVGTRKLPWSALTRAQLEISSEKYPTGEIYCHCGIVIVLLDPLP
jgi:hypothetical protein